MDFCGEGMSMGFYVRTSLKAGPFRFTLSSAGFGVSAGVPGFRVGMGPRGNYVRMGAGTISYRTTLPRPAAHQAIPQPHLPPAPPGPGITMHDVTGAAIQNLVATDASDIVRQLQAAARRWPLWPFALAVFVLIGLTIGGWGLLIILISAPAVIWLAFRDRAARSVVVMYDVNDEAAQRFAHIVQAITALQNARRLWHIAAAGAVTTTYQYKVNSGASKLLQRHPAALTLTGPRCLVTNVAVPTLTAGRRSVHFLPDRVLLQEGKHFADIPYQHLHVTTSTTRFIETGPLPADGHVVDSTWRYVNVKGGPDRRFKNNAQLPVLLYGRLVLQSTTGLNLVWDASQHPPIAAVGRALRLAAAAQAPGIRP
ncbi:DUF4236 domain-containing protein [Nonomuraea sp. NPDC003804]|uniref:DUF4236 domain-containing protein n=1 Tax=Nonomuraea sp. NPDC003804 TaxID=3154547 RepID=UPI0033BABE8E